MPDEEICELKRKSEILDRVLLERENLMAQMQKNASVEGAICTIAEKAKLADKLMKENQVMLEQFESLQ